MNAAFSFSRLTSARGSYNVGSEEPEAPPYPPEGMPPPAALRPYEAAADMPP